MSDEQRRGASFQPLPVGLGPNKSTKHKSKHDLSTNDREFLSRFESCLVPKDEFRHLEHVRLAYILLVQNDAEEAHAKYRTVLRAFIDHHSIGKSKYHETMTRAWVLAVDHFMDLSEPSDSSEEFISLNPRLLKADIMLTHYSKDVLFSKNARTTFVEPDLDPIPRSV